VGHQADDFVSGRLAFSQIGSEKQPLNRLSPGKFLHVDGKKMNVIIVKDGNSLQSATLERTDWQKMNPFMRCLVSLFGAFGLCVAHYEHASPAQIKEINNRIGEEAPEPLRIQWSGSPSVVDDAIPTPASRVSGKRRTCCG
jgi:hypothetical protein